MENEPDILPAESDAGAFTPPPETPLPEGSPMPDTRRPAPHPDPYPFWGYADLVVFFGLAFPCVLLGAFTVKFFLWVFRIRVHSLALELVPAQFLGYGFLFSALYLLLTVHYRRPFWQSLRWVRTRPGISRTVLYGFVMAVVVALFHPVRFIDRRAASGVGGLGGRVEGGRIHVNGSFRKNGPDDKPARIGPRKSAGRASPSLASPAPAWLRGWRIG